MNRWARIRWWTRLLAVIDWLLGTHLLQRTTSQWRQKIETMQAEINSIETRLEELNVSRGAILRHLCLSYLHLRQTQSPADWFHFDPQVPTEESAIEIMTRALVAPHYARWRINQMVCGDANHYTYDLVPDWTALYQDALNHETNLAPSLLNWLAEHMQPEALTDD
jgi:hypothetical protein